MKLYLAAGLIIITLLSVVGAFFYGYTVKSQNVKLEQVEEYLDTRKRVEDATSNPLDYDAAIKRLQHRQNTNKP